jgi:hypothetical protein
MGWVSVIADVIETPGRVVDAIVPPHTSDKDVTVTETKTETIITIKK